MISQAYANTLSDWPETCLVVVAVLRGTPALAYNAFIGIVAVKHLFLLGVCSFYMGRREQDKPHLALAGLLHVRLLFMGVVIVLTLTAAQVAIRVSPQYQDSSGPKHVDSEQSVALLCHITASVMLLTFIGHHLVVCRTHWQEARQANGLSEMVHPRDGSTDFNAFARRPMLPLSSNIAGRFQDCRDAYVDSVAKTSRASTANNTVISVVLAAACVVILVSSYHLVDSITPSDTKEQSAWWRLNVPLTTFLVGLTECAAVCVHRWQSSHSIAAEVTVATLGSTARLLSALLSIATLVGWSLGATVLVLPINAFHCALLTVASLMQKLSRGW
jgi:Ca2+/Na+ antiporter